MQDFLWLIPLGVVVGAIGTLIGAGGGFVLMPILLLAYPSDSPDLLTAISLSVVFCNGASGSVAYGRMRRIDYRSGLVMAAAAVPGAILGAMITGYLPRGPFDLVLGSLLVLASAFLLWHPRPEGKGGHALAPELAGRTRMGTYNLPLAVGLSFVVGVISSLIGVGGGIIHVPAMVHLLNFPVHVATATSHFILALTALAGTGVHAARSDMTAGWVRIIGLGIGMVVGAQAGAWLSSRLHGRWIIRILAIVLGLVGVRVLLLAL
jgi:uncharacterized protein